MAPGIPRIAQHRAKRMIRDLQSGAFVVLAFPEDDSDDLRIYVSGLDPEKMRRIEQFVETVINE